MSIIRGGGHVHKMIRGLAIEMAAEIYDKLMVRNEWYDLWKRKNPNVSDPNELMLRYVDRTWPTLVEQARATLAGMLTRPISEDLKLSIHDALIKDAKFRPGRIESRKSKVRHLTPSELN